MSHRTRVRDLHHEPFEELTEFLLRVANLAPTADWRVSRLQQFIDEHDGRIGCILDDVCRTLDLGVTSSHASRLFRRALGLETREYSKLKRLHAGATKLQTTSMSVKEIAADLGYRVPADFFRQFKQLFQVTPLRFRTMTRVRSRVRKMSA